MRRHVPVVAAAAAVLVLCGAASIASAQPGAGGVSLPVAEVWGSLVLSPAPGDATVITKYVPQFSGELVSGLGTQVLSLSPGARPGVEIGTAVFPSRLAGLEVRFERVAWPIAGTSSSHDVSIVYLARQPPAYELKQYSYARATPWDDPSGSLDVSAISVNGVVRAAVTSRVRVAASGGLTVARVGGTFESVGFTVFHLGGHAVLFPDTAAFDLEMGPATLVGLNVGASVDLDLGHRVALTAGYRWVALGTVEPDLEARHLLNHAEFFWDIDSAAVRSALTADGPSFDLDHGRLTLGLKVTW